MKVTPFSVCFIKVEIQKYVLQIFSTVSLSKINILLSIKRNFNFFFFQIAKFIYTCISGARVILGKVKLTNIQKKEVASNCVTNENKANSITRRYHLESLVFPRISLSRKCYYLASQFSHCSRLTSPEISSSQANVRFLGVFDWTDVT